VIGQITREAMEIRKEPLASAGRGALKRSEDAPRKMARSSAGHFLSWPSRELLGRADGRRSADAASRRRGL